MRLSSLKINLEVLNHIQRRLRALCTIREKTDWSLTPKVSVKKKHLLMKEIHVFHVRWFILDKGAEQTAAGAAAASGSGNPSQRCVSLLIYSICFGAMHISPHLHRGPSGTSRRPSGDTHTVVAAGTLPGCGVPIIPPPAQQICLQTRCRCRASGGSGRPFFQAAPGSVSSQPIALCSHSRELKKSVITICQPLKEIHWLHGRKP